MREQAGGGPTERLQPSADVRLPHARAADYEAVVKLSEGFNGADLRNVCTEAGPWPGSGR